MKVNKYRNKITEVDGIKFHSKREAKRYQELRVLEKWGVIENLETQPRIPLMVNGQKIGHYVGDFRYKENGKVKIEDVKSPATITPLYKIKKKILLTYEPPIVINEVLD